MDSRIYENADGQPDIDRVLEKADADLARLDEDRAAIAERRRALVAPRYKTVVAEPTEVHNKIALGGVLVNHGLSAIDADALAGLLAFWADQVWSDMDELIDTEPSVSFGQAIVMMIDRHDRDLSARGLYETWRRRLVAYDADRAEWLARNEEYRLEGAWREEGMTRNQRWLIRVTCRLRGIDVPGHLSRGDAADWLEAHGANLNYREFVA
ncbi:hypothetical protein [Sphingomonas yantingensis]|uniref:Uncharacterized protein n=1 Tax=Sphingomonas yantingensis TaxID=1241761 RepID=A0A7W9AM35_9SPHN|nr:hypothetical protein [Sphingomonas yantingensis]MBB5696980.1 hypothetical protein [Sphingomonas yantingensis]